LHGDLDQGYTELSRIIRDTKNPKVRDELVRCIRWRSDNGDQKAANVLLENYSLLDSDLQSEIKKLAPWLITGFIDQEITPGPAIKVLSELLEINEQELIQTLKFLNDLKSAGVHYFSPNEAPKLRDYIKLAKNPEILPLILELKQYGYSFDIAHVDLLPELLSKRTEIFSAISEIKKNFPKYRYTIYYQSRYNLKTETWEQYYVTDPYIILSNQTSPEKFLDTLFTIQQQTGSFSQKFSDGLLHSLRLNDSLLSRTADKEALASQKQLDKFYHVLKEFIDKVINPNGELRQYQDLFVNSHCLRFVAREPDHWGDLLKIPEVAPRLLSLLSAGGPLFSNKDIVIRNIFENGDVLRRVRNIENNFTRRVEYWKQLFLFTDVRIGKRLASAETNYPIDNINGIPLTRLAETLHGQRRLTSAIANQEAVKKIESGEATTVPFSELTGSYKRLVFRDCLKRTIRLSRSAEAKTASDFRNRNASAKLELKPGTYIHGSAVDYIESVLLNGNLPREALGEGAETDAYPFHVDFSNLSQEYLESQKTIEDIFNNSLSARYGVGGSMGINGQIFYVYDRDNTNWERGKRYGPSENHGLIFGGIPATEISAIVLRSPEHTLKRVKNAICENGFYIPVYNLQGEIIFNSEEYDSIISDRNLTVPVEVWDYSMKTGEQRGSNPGGEFTVPSREGPTKYYVKFAQKETGHIWNEQLANNIYRLLGIPVPDTKIVKIENNYGHASQILPKDAETDRKKLKDGFLIDCLLANWDIVANESNVLSSNGILYRIDNGGALLYRARGERKNIDETVIELETMRSAYPELTSDDINEQLKLLKEKFTDEVIERLVDGVRLPKEDREFLKNILRRRRDYILRYYGQNG